PSDPALFPADAGMYRFAGQSCILLGPVPRRRGDVPPDYRAWCWLLGCSPQTRGCTVVHACSLCYSFLFPADAGMYRTSGFSVAAYRPVPRRRGDVPVLTVAA